MSDLPSNPVRATVTAEYQRDWPAYFEAVRGLPARETLTRALELFEADGRGGATGAARRALDVACGEGRDTRALLARGWRVVAIDASEEGLRRLVESVRSEDRARVETRRLEMERVAEWLGGGEAERGAAFDLVNASFALPFCRPEAFAGLWRALVGVIRASGRFAGQFFGDRDEWATVRPGSHHTREQVLGLLSAFEIEHLDEVEKDGGDAMGGVKHHHLFHVVARKRG